jgi:hypothetical protein
VLCNARSFSLLQDCCLTAPQRMPPGSAQSAAASKRGTVAVLAHDKCCAGCCRAGVHQQKPLALISGSSIRNCRAIDACRRYFIDCTEGAFSKAAGKLCFSINIGAQRCDKTCHCCKQRR